jgi:hypothetical protein
LARLTGFLLVNLSVIPHYGLRLRSRAWLRHRILPAGGAAVVVDILPGLQPGALELGAAWLLPGVAIRFLMPRVAARPRAG